MENHVCPNTSQRYYAMPADSSENLQLAHRNDGQNQPQLPETDDIIANKNKRFLIKENVFLDLFAMVFEEHN